MKYTLMVNQLAAAELGDVDVIDCCIIDWARDMCVTASPKVENKRIDGYTWINYTHAVKDLPLLGLQKPGFCKRIKSIVAKGYFVSMTTNQRVYIKPAPKLDLLYTSDRSRQETDRSRQETVPFTPGNGSKTHVTGVNRFPQETNPNPYTKSKQRNHITIEQLKKTDEEPAALADLWPAAEPSKSEDVHEPIVVEEATLRHLEAMRVYRQTHGTLEGYRPTSPGVVDMSTV